MRREFLFAGIAIVGFAMVFVAGGGVAFVGLLLVFGDARAWGMHLALSWIAIALLLISPLLSFSPVLHRVVKGAGLSALLCAWASFMAVSESLMLTLMTSVPMFAGVYF